MLEVFGAEKRRPGADCGEAGSWTVAVAHIVDFLLLAWQFQVLGTTVLSDATYAKITQSPGFCGTHSSKCFLSALPGTTVLSDANLCEDYSCYFGLALAFRYPLPLYVAQKVFLRALGTRILLFTTGVLIEDDFSITFAGDN